MNILNLELEKSEFFENDNFNYEEYWNPYLSQYKYLKDYWFVCDHPNQGDIYLKSPFLNSQYNLEKKYLESLNPLKSALSRKESFERMISSDNINDIDVAISMVEKHSRDKYLLNYFLNTKYSKKFKDEELWNVICEVWCNVEFPCPTKKSRNLWKRIFSVRTRPNVLINHLPKTFTVYRGGQIFGLSWSRSIDVAKQFQARNRLLSGKNVMLFKTEVSREEILFEGVREDEVVIAPNCLDRKIKCNQIQII